MFSNFHYNDIFEELFLRACQQNALYKRITNLSQLKIVFFGLPIQLDRIFDLKMCGLKNEAPKEAI